MRTKILILLAICLFAACKPSAVADQPSPNAKRYEFKGKIVSVDRAAKKATIAHDAIKGYMDAMTMEFPIHADWVWENLTPGSEIRADLVVDNSAKDPFYLDNVSITAASDANTSALPLNENFVQVGSEVPDFTFTNQDGKKISLKQFSGKALAITFIYAKCPLPDYCIRMSTNFSDLANKLKADPVLKDKIRLLSISFDPANDTPEKLRSYGIGYLGKDAKPDFTIWQLATGTDAEVRKVADFFGLRYEVDPNDKTLINHSLRTAVIGPDGKVAKIFTGNDWTPDDLLAEMQGTLG